MLPADVRALALAHRTRQQQLAALATTRTRLAWRYVDPSAPAASWDRLAGRQAFALLLAAQAEAARGVDDYVSAVVAAWGETPDPAGTVAPRAFAGVASDGRDLGTLLRQPITDVEALVSGGMPVADALGVGLRHLERIVATQVADAARGATGVALTADRRVTSYTRQLNPPSCSRCVILAGKQYRVNRGFQRHPYCDCVHVPTVGVLSADALTSPRQYFDSLSEQEQNRAFTMAGARAIRDGADISQVVNARRGAAGLRPAGARLTDAETRMLRGGRARGRLERTDVFGHRLYTTTEGTTTRGLAGTRLGARETGRMLSGGRYRQAQVPRLMPESIYAEAQRLGWSREETIRQLRRFGYIL